MSLPVDRWKLITKKLPWLRRRLCHRLIATTETWNVCRKYVFHTHSLLAGVIYHSRRLGTCMVACVGSDYTRHSWLLYGIALRLLGTAPHLRRKLQSRVLFDPKLAAGHFWTVAWIPSATWKRNRNRVTGESPQSGIWYECLTNVITGNEHAFRILLAVWSDVNCQSVRLCIISLSSSVTLLSGMSQRQSVSGRRRGTVQLWDGVWTDQQLVWRFVAAGRACPRPHWTWVFTLICRRSCLQIDVKLSCCKFCTILYNVDPHN